MDNRNDFIHIDEVFKRLKDKEEPEPSGAWLRMQELLNEEMPVGAPAAGSILRKYMTPLVALLLLGSGVAFYTVHSNNAKDAQKVSFATGNHASDKYSNATSIPSSNENDMGLKSNPNNHQPNNHSSNNNNNNNDNSDNNTVTAANNTSSKGNNHNEHQYTSGNNSHSTQHHSNNKNGVNTAETVAASGVQSHHTVASNAHPASSSNSNSKNDAHQNGSHSNTIKGASTQASQNAVAQNGSANTSGNIGNNAVAQNNSKTSGASKANGASANNVTGSKAQTSNTIKHPVSMEEQNVVEQIFPASSNGNKNTHSGTVMSSDKHGGKGDKSISAGSVTAAAGMIVVADNWNNDKIVKDKDGSYYKEVRDTFKKIDMMQRTVASNENTQSGAQRYTNVIDTLAITRVERIKYQPLAPLEMVALRQAKIIPQTYIASPLPASTKPKQYTVTNEMVSLVPLANYKVNSRKVDPSKFNQLMLNATQGISNYFDGSNKFYAAILLGGNTFIGNTGAFGMQFGIAGLYQLSERLTMGVEIKFANHYFSNYTINDKSVSYDNISSQQISGLEWLFKGTQTTTNTAYKVNSFSELQFPITLNYSFGRLSAFGGLNLAYAFPVKWSISNNVVTENVSSTETNSNNPFLNANATIDNSKDFDSRFGMGYVGGLSYDLSRKISLDARVTQNLWSSYNGNADNVSKLFKTPTFQFSISYFFGRKERVVYIMDKR